MRNYSKRFICLLWTLYDQLLPFLFFQRAAFSIFIHRFCSCPSGPLCLLVFAEPTPAVTSFLAKCDNLLDFPVAPDIGIVDDSTEVGLESHPPFLDEMWLFVGLAPKVSNREGGHFVLTR